MGASCAPISGGIPRHSSTDWPGCGLFIKGDDLLEETSLGNTERGGIPEGDPRRRKTRRRVERSLSGRADKVLGPDAKAAPQLANVYAMYDSSTGAAEGAETP
eukprot:Hpha_TRINITY_DN15844_c0_g1::TRINITY_DN15844_c0_g1_i2::g.187186::m.187186